MKNSFLVLIITILTTPFTSSAQTAPATQDSLPPLLNLEQCLVYALQNQPAARQARIDEAINEKDVRINLAAWLPQVNSANTATHYFKGSPAQAQGAVANGGTATQISNISIIGIQATQVIYNNDVNLASKAAKFSKQYYNENTINAQIAVMTDVSKGYYDVLLSQKQLQRIKEDITRLQRSLKDAKARYDAGVVDKIDYKQATIALNNSLASRKQTEEAIKSKSAYLRQVMGMPMERPLTLAYDSVGFEREAIADTNQIVNPADRIEYRMQESRRSITALNINYYKYGWLPSLNANGAFNRAYFSGSLPNLYDQGFPNVYAGLSLTIPIFTGTRRVQNLAKAKLQVERADLDIINVRNTINTQYAQALAGYKSNYNNWKLLKQNVDLAKDVYNVVSLQYREGVKTYLDLIVSQSDLRTAELNYLNALFQLLSSKVDLQRSLGTIGNINKQ
ncbi:TolC family protein [Mucilaginibacter myungsuensis]|uniref:TolC family protein n=1 Tax=Mucilaginibacter myungsuensis TaxID=649104 RepID=A0A929KUM3_9SPHI|nr:TolC family protein [Mucilaginibacter myungsuensis]MBE9661886.1 TolC family protein [Mucilaginibacter myungsuensis]MDN3599680.1 TolC family protein [Mucilaginibacter myungsuensis]